MPKFIADQNLLFGILALKADLIDAREFADACAEWSNQKDTETDLAGIFRKRGSLDPAGIAAVDYLLRLRLKRRESPQPNPTSSRGGSGGVADSAPDSDAWEALTRMKDSVIPAETVQQPALLQDKDTVRISTIDLPLGSRDRYALSRLHAKGGIGQIWMARDTELGRTVALKELRSDKAESLAVQHRFLEEAKVTAQLEHPGIVPVYELARTETEESPYYTMRFVNGRTLSEAVHAWHKERAIGKASGLEQSRLLQAFVTVCQTMAYAHARGVIHRDLKGQNIVLGEYGEVIVLDWGLAKLVKPPRDSPGLPPPITSDIPSALHSTATAASFSTESESSTANAKPQATSDNGTQHGQVLGTPPYMSPEQASGRVDLIGPASDVYGLGAILYEILTGCPPFDGTDTHKTLWRVVHESPRAPKAINPSAPRALEAVCLKCLNKEPQERYPSAAALAQDVQRFLADLPVTAYREPIAARTARFGRRHKTLAASAAIMLVSAVLALSFGTILMAKARERIVWEQHLAGEDFSRAVATIDKINATCEELLRNRPGLHGLQRELLSHVQEYYKNYLDIHGQDIRVTLKLSEAAFKIAKITQQVGTQDEALAAYADAMERHWWIVRRSPENREVWRRLAEIHYNRGVLQIDISGQVVFAKESLNAARTILERLSQEDPNDAATQVVFADCEETIANLDLITGASWMDYDERSQHVLKLRRELASADDDAGHHARSLADSLLEQANVRADAGEETAALVLIREALGVSKRLVETDPEDVEAQVHLARAKLGEAIAYHWSGRLAEAAKTVQESIGIWQKLSDKNPIVENYQRNLAVTYMRLAKGQLLGDETVAGEETLGKALKICEDLVLAHPRNIWHKHLLVQTLLNLSLLQDRRGSAESSRELLTRALKIQEELSRDNPQFFPILSQLNSIRSSLGLLKRKQGQPKEAVSELAAALRDQKQLVLTHPEIPQYRRDLIFTCCTLAAVHMMLNQPKDAAGAINDALMEHHGITDHKPLDYYNLACMQALYSMICSKLDKTDTKITSNEMADQAMQSLRQAIDKGFAGLFYLEKDPDLEPLRQRADFQKLLESVRSQSHKDRQFGRLKTVPQESPSEQIRPTIPANPTVPPSPTAPAKVITG